MLIDYREDVRTAGRVKDTSNVHYFHLWNRMMGKKQNLPEWKSGQILVRGRKSTFNHGKYKKCKDIQCRAGEELNEQTWTELDSKVTIHRPWQGEIRYMIGHCFTDRLRTWHIIVIIDEMFFSGLSLCICVAFIE